MLSSIPFANIPKKTQKSGLVIWSWGRTIVNLFFAFFLGLFLLLIFLFLLSKQQLQDKNLMPKNQQVYFFTLIYHSLSACMSLAQETQKIHLRRNALVFLFRSTFSPSSLLKVVDTWNRYSSYCSSLKNRESYTKPEAYKASRPILMNESYTLASTSKFVLSL